MTNYKCSDSKNGWEPDNYQIDFEDINSKKMAIWNNRQICVSNIKTKKSALACLKKEFKNVELLKK